MSTEAVTEEPPLTIQVPEWAHIGNMFVRRAGLSPSHPESTYNYIKNVLHLRPEDYKIYGEEKKHRCPKCDHRYSDLDLEAAEEARYAYGDHHGVQP